MKKVITLILLLVIFSALESCRINYSFSGASIPPEVKSFTVLPFQNRAPVFQPTLATTFTNALQDKIQQQTTLKMAYSNGDVTFEGEITDYSTEPIAIQGDNLAGQTRLTITVRVKYTDETNPDNNFDEKFKRYEDFESTLNLSDVENTLIESIVEQLSEDIFNKAFVNW